MTGLDDVTRAELRRADEKAGDDNGEFAERLVAAAYGLDHENDVADWYDAVHPRGTKYEVKATQKVIDGEDKDRFVPTVGRFRVWKGQTRSLINSSAADGQTAWFVFVLLDRGGDPGDMRRVSPSTVWRWVTERRDGWHSSGHANPDRDAQHKLPIDVVFPGVEVAV